MAGVALTALACDRDTAEEPVMTPKIARAFRVGLELEWRDAVRAGETPATASGSMPVGWRPGAGGGSGGEPPAPLAGVAGTPPGDRPCHTCGNTPTRRFMNAWLCEACAPPQAYVDPERTAAALRARRGRQLRAVHTAGR